MKCKYCGTEVIKGYYKGQEVLFNKRRERKILYKTTWLERVRHTCKNLIKDIKTED